MARISGYKQYERQQRHAVLDSDFSKGMMHSNGVVNEGYLKSLVNFTYDKDGGKIIPRPAIRPSTVIFPDLNINPGNDFLSESVTIKDGKECTEENRTYKQFILGKVDPTATNLGDIWVTTSEAFSLATNVELDDNYTADVKYAIGKDTAVSHKCCYYTVESSEIHKVPVKSDRYKRMEFPVGTFAYGNSYYFFGQAEDPDTQEIYKGLFRTKFDSENEKYVFEKVEPKVPTASEASTYGYNMLIPQTNTTGPYVFNDHTGASVLQLNGILPYDSNNPNKLMMTPKKNQHINFRCYYDTPLNKEYDIIWEWRETTSSDWITIQKNIRVRLDPSAAENTNGVLKTLEYQGFIPPATDMMVRVSAYPYVNGSVSDVVEKAMTVGFDFTIENYGTASALDQEEYDLTTATGMEVWNDRLVVWGLPEDPTILFISDYNEPGYFPYPNNITVFDNPIIAAVEFMDGLAVFTTDKLYYVTLAEDGNSWKTELLQSHLHIEPWDKHLIQTVRNMIFFKSGNYYYMEVPKAQSTTGELTLAPITTPITNFFDNFSVNVQSLLEETYDYKDTYKLLTYYNFLDYEDINNVYVFSHDMSESLLYVDVIYNTVDRTWKVWIYEGVQILFPYRHDATQSGLLAATSLINVQYKNDAMRTEPRRFIQLFVLDKNIVRDFYIPSMTPVLYNPTFEDAAVQGTILVFPQDDELSVEGTMLIIPDGLSGGVELTTAILANISDYYKGYYKSNIGKMLKEVYSDPDGYFKFKNYQFIDTGYRDNDIHAKKRYRELQIQLNNLDKRNMDFGMEYILDGAPRRIYYKYDVAQAIDEFDPEYGVVYIDSVPFLETDLNDIDITNQWTLDQDLTPDIALWKVRVAISGKGYAPRFKMKSRNEKRFELMSVNWISKVMHMR